MCVLKRFWGILAAFDEVSVWLPRTNILKGTWSLGVEQRQLKPPNAII